MNKSYSGIFFDFNAVFVSFFLIKIGDQIFEAFQNREGERSKLLGSGGKRKIKNYLPSYFEDFS